MFFRYEGEIVYLITNTISEIWNIFSCTRSLLVLDDIWDSWVLKAFDNQCQVLITSRDRSVTDAVSGKEWSSLLHYKSWMYVYAKCFCVLLKKIDRIHVCQAVHKWQSFSILLCKTMLFHKIHVICCPVYMSILRITALFSKISLSDAAVFQLIISTYEVVSEPDPLFQIFLRKFSQLP